MHEFSGSLGLDEMLSSVRQACKHTPVNRSYNHLLFERFEARDNNNISAPGSQSGIQITDSSRSPRVAGLHTQDTEV